MNTQTIATKRLPRLDTTTIVSAATIGVVIPVYNRKTTLVETLRHVLAQSRLPDRLVIADDGSTDGTGDAAGQLLEDAKPPFSWRVLRLSHTTAATARVRGYAALGQIDYVAFLDSDDHWPKDFLQRTIAALESNDNAVAACVDRRYTDLSGQIQGVDDCQRMAAAPLPWFFRRGAGVASCTLVRSVAYEAVGGWKPELRTAEDSALFSSLALCGEWVHSAGAPVDFYLGHAAARGEENNLSRRRPDAQYRWARIYRYILQKIQQQRPDLADAELRRLLAARWYNAGKDFMGMGRSRAASVCFRRSVRTEPKQLRAWRRLFEARRRAA